LIVGAVGLALNDDLFSNAQESQKNINVYVVISQMTDIDLRGANLSASIPKNIAITRITRRCAGVCLIKEQI
jgi:hypothetical protein